MVHSPGTQECVGDTRDNCAVIRHDDSVVESCLGVAPYMGQAKCHTVTHDRMADILACINDIVSLLVHVTSS